MDMKGLDVNHHLIDFICLTPINTVDGKVDTLQGRKGFLYWICSRSV